MSDILDAGMDSNVVPPESEMVPFLVRDLDPVRLEEWRLQADDERVSVSELMRQHLCQFFGFECPHMRSTSRMKKKRKRDSTTLLLWLHAELHYAIKLRARTEGLSMQVVVKAALGA